MVMPQAAMPKLCLTGAVTAATKGESHGIERNFRAMEKSITLELIETVAGVSENNSNNVSR